MGTFPGHGVGEGRAGQEARQLTHNPERQSPVARRWVGPMGAPMDWPEIRAQRHLVTVARNVIGKRASQSQLCARRRPNHHSFCGCPVVLTGTQNTLF